MSVLRNDDGQHAKRRDVWPCLVNSMTSGRENYMEIGSIDSEDPWAVVSYIGFTPLCIWLENLLCCHTRREDNSQCVPLWYDFEFSGMISLSSRNKRLWELERTRLHEKVYDYERLLVSSIWLLAFWSPRNEICGWLCIGYLSSWYFWLWLYHITQFGYVLRDEVWLIFFFHLWNKILWIEGLNTIYTAHTRRR